MTASRTKGIVLVAGLVVSALTLISWTQPWFRVALGTEAASEGAVSVGGEVAAGGLAALGLAGLALVGALSIAGPVFRIVLAALEALIGLAVVLSATIALADPVRASAATLTESTGITGDESLAALAGEVQATPWPVIAVVLGVSTVVVGVVIAVTSSRWPASSRKYAATRLAAEPAVQSDRDAFDGRPERHPIHVDPSVESRDPLVSGGSSDMPSDGSAVAARESDSVADWDALSHGSDPTSR